MRSLVGAFAVVYACRNGAPMRSPPVTESRPKPVPAVEPDKHEEEISTAMATALRGESPDVADMSPRRPGADLRAQIEDVRIAGKDVAIGSRGGRGAREARPPPPSVPPPGPSPAGRITVSGQHATDETTLTAEVVTAKILTAYLPGLKRCYKHALAVDPRLAGRLELAFTVNEAGRAVSGTAKFANEELAACASGLIASWRFAIPKDRDLDPTDAGFRLTLTLAPE